MGNCFFFWPNVIFFQFRTNFIKEVFVPNALQKICKFHFAHIAFGTKNSGTSRLPIENQDVLEKKTAQFLLTHGQDTHIKENNILKSKNGILRGWVNGKVFFFYLFHNVTFQFRTNFPKDIFVPNALQIVCKFFFAHIAFGTKNSGTSRFPIKK